MSRHRAYYNPATRPFPPNYTSQAKRPIDKAMWTSRDAERVAKAEAKRQRKAEQRQRQGSSVPDERPDHLHPTD